MAYATVTLTGTYQTPDGTPHKGHVEIIPSERVIKDTTGNVILTGRVKVELDAQGAFTVALPATDDPTLNPTGFGYTIAAKLHSSHPPAVSFSLPASLGATTVEDLTPGDPSTFAPTTTYAEKSELDAVAATIPTTAADVNALPDTTQIPSTAADVGALPDTTVIPSTAADVGAEPAGLSQGTQDQLAATFAGIENQTAGGRTVFFGDSTIDQSGTATFNDDAAQGATSIPMWINTLTRGRITPIRNAGIGGNNTAQMLARIDADVLAYNPNLVVMMAGINDVKGGVSLATSQANLTAMFDKIAQAKAYLIIGTVTPSILVDTTVEKQNLFALNRWLIEQGRIRRGITVVDLYPLVADRQTIAWRTGYSPDGTHQSPLGAWTIAKAFAEAITALRPTPAAKITRSAADPYELAPNPTMNGNTSGVANSTNIVGGGTATKVARTDGIPGEWQQVVQSTSATGFIFQTVTGVTAGTKYDARIEVKASGVSATQFMVYTEFRDASNAVVGAAPSVNFLDNNGAPGDFEGVFDINPATAPAGATTVRLAVKWIGTGTFSVGAISCRVKGT